MPDERLEVSVTFDERGYIGIAPELRSAVVALSLGGLRRKVEIAMLPDDVRVVLQLDGRPAAHPELVIAVMNAASSDWAASRLAVAIEQVAVAVGRGRAHAERSRHRACTRGDASMMPALEIERCEQSYTDTDARSAQTYSYRSAFSHQPPTQERPRTLADVIGWCLSSVSA